MCVLGHVKCVCSVHVCLHARDATWSHNSSLPEAGSGASRTTETRLPCRPQSHPMPLGTASAAACLSCGFWGESRGGSLLLPTPCTHPGIPRPFFRGARGISVSPCLAAWACPTGWASSPAFQAIGPRPGRGGAQDPNLDQFCRLQEGRAPAECFGGHAHPREPGRAEALMCICAGVSLSRLPLLCVLASLGSPSFLGEMPACLELSPVTDPGKVGFVYMCCRLVAVEAVCTESRPGAQWFQVLSPLSIWRLTVGCWVLSC